MRSLLLLLAVSAFGQITFGPRPGNQGWFDRRCFVWNDSGSCGAYFVNYVPRQYEYRIDWLRPDLYLWPSGKPYELGSVAHTWGHEGFNGIYISAPFRTLTILLPNGKRVEISRAEIEGRAK